MCHCAHTPPGRTDRCGADEGRCGQAARHELYGKLPLGLPRFLCERHAAAVSENLETWAEMDIPFALRELPR